MSLITIGQSQINYLSSGTSVSSLLSSNSNLYLNTDSGNFYFTSFKNTIANVSCDHLTVSTVSSINITTTNLIGTLSTIGSLILTNTTDATSSTNGGALTVAGGLAIAKTLYANTINSLNPFGYITGNGAQSLTSGGTNTITTYWNQTLILQGGMTFTNGTFTIPVAGIYSISASVSTTGSSTGQRYMWITKNGNTAAFDGWIGIQASSSGATALSVSNVMQLAVNDQISVIYQQTSGATLSMDAGYRGNFSVFKVG